MGTRPVEGVQGPDWDDVTGLEECPPVAIPVEIAEQLTVRLRPTVDCQVVTRLLSAGVGTKLVNSEPLRSRIIIFSDADYYIGNSKSAVEQAIGKIPTGRTLELTNTAQLWVAPATATYVTAVCEYWAN